MSRRLFVTLPAIVVAVLALAFVRGDGVAANLVQDASTPGAGPYRLFAPNVAADSAPTPATSTVTLADDGTTITMHRGDTFLLMLGTDYNWDVQVSDTSILARVPNITVIRGAQGIYQALGMGSTTLTATGVLSCPPGTACPMLARLFRLDVNVVE